MALRWTAAPTLEAKKGFRKLKAYKQLPALRIALKAHHEKASSNSPLARRAKAAYVEQSRRSLRHFQQSSEQSLIHFDSMTMALKYLRDNGLAKTDEEAGAEDVSI
jgi:hypothetical protein